MLENLTVVLVKSKYPENVGAAARACANMGCPNIVLVDPYRWDMDKAKPMATGQALEILRGVSIEDDLPTALAPFTLTYGTTARTGGYRKGLRLPPKAAEEIARELRNGGKAAIVFGPEDRGLVNEETQVCGRLVTIPTASGNKSLNVAQAVLIMLYECFKAAAAEPFSPAGPPEAKLATNEEQELLMATLKDVLADIDYLKPGDSNYWMLPVKRFLNRAPLKRNEFNLLMGICRQVKWIAGKK
jgi:tRNA/rRNA methyltransferase